MEPVDDPIIVDSSVERMQDVMIVVCVCASRSEMVVAKRKRGL